MVGYYGNVSEPFTNQLRSLEQYATQNPSAGEAYFLLGYLYQGMGYSEQAQKQFAKAADLSPRDGLANSLAGKSNAGETTAPVVKPTPRTVPPNPKPVVVPQPR